MLSSIVRLIRRYEVKSVDQVAKQAVKLVREESDEKYFRPPPPPETSFFLNLAYQPTNPKSKLQTAIASTAANSSRSTDILVDKIVELLLKRLGSGKKNFHKAKGKSSQQSSQSRDKSTKKPRTATVDEKEPRNHSLWRQSGDNTVYKRKRKEVIFFEYRKPAHVKINCPDV